VSRTDPEPITDLLNRWALESGEASADALGLVYGELKRIASGYLHHERAGHLHQTTSIVHEAYLRLSSARGVSFKNRGHFFAFAARLMRRLLVDLARERGRARRGGGLARVELGDLESSATLPDDDVLALDEALDELSRIDCDKARVVELRFFAGLSINETARALGISISTVNRQWRLARMWLHERLRAAC
jgi:RNA polymerase sigma factor (TIGR02999 family)